MITSYILKKSTFANGMKHDLRKPLKCFEEYWNKKTSQEILRFSK